MGFCFLTHRKDMSFIGSRSAGFGGFNAGPAAYGRGRYAHQRYAGGRFADSDSYYDSYADEYTYTLKRRAQYEGKSHPEKLPQYRGSSSSRTSSSSAKSSSGKSSSRSGKSSRSSRK